MKRFDLRHLGDNFDNRMCEIINNDLQINEIGIFLFEMGDFSNVKKAINLIAQNGWELMNSLRFNEVDWSIVIKKSSKIAESTQDSTQDSNIPAESIQDSNAKSNAESTKDSTKIPIDSTQGDS